MSVPLPKVRISKTITDHQAHVTQFQYDANGNRKKVIDAELKETSYLYDERDLLFTVTDAKGGVTTYSYDGNGNLSTIKDANTKKKGSKKVPATAAKKVPATAGGDRQCLFMGRMI